LRQSHNSERDALHKISNKDLKQVLRESNFVKQMTAEDGFVFAKQAQDTIKKRNEVIEVLTKSGESRKN
jgi:hypothetical protein